MKKIDAMKNELESIVMSASKRKLEKILFIIKFVTNATPDEIAELTKQMKNKDFNVSNWIESKRPLELEVV